VLHLKEKPANPDSVYLIYQLAKGVDEFDLKQGSELTAVKIRWVSNSFIKRIRSLSLIKLRSKNSKRFFWIMASPIKNIYVAPVANSADGKGEKFKDPETACPVLDILSQGMKGDKITGEKGKIRVCHCITAFLLSGGERTILIKIKFDQAPAGFRIKSPGSQ